MHKWLQTVEKRRCDIAQTLTAPGDLGQFFTPHEIASQMAELVPKQLMQQKEITISDPGAGIGMLSAHLIMHLLRGKAQHITLDTYEKDPRLKEHLMLTLQEAEKLARDQEVTLNWSILDDYLEEAKDAQTRYDIIITNPPYKKIIVKSAENETLQHYQFHTTNLYTAFLGVCRYTLKEHGVLIAITPRSFANGTYFQKFRRMFFSDLSLRHIQIFESRKGQFDNVLQENIIFAVQKNHSRAKPQVTVIHERADGRKERLLCLPTDIIHPEDPSMVLHIPVRRRDIQIARKMRQMPCRLEDLGLAVSTGPVVDFRLKDYLYMGVTEQTVPLIYPTHLAQDHLNWPKISAKPNSIANLLETKSSLVPVANYVLVKRFTSKEQTRRIHATLLLEDDLAGHDYVGIENHINYFHAKGHAIHPDLALGLCAYLNSSFVDESFRIFSGHTQVNATDLKSLRYPTHLQLQWLASRIKRHQLANTSQIDSVIGKIISSS